jgi:hypothetical protein
MRKAILMGVVMVALAAGTRAESPSSSSAMVAASQPSTLTAVRAFPEKILTIPTQTEVSVQLLSGIHTEVSHVGDAIRAQLVQPIYVDGRVALPQGSLLDGRITQIRAAGRLRRPAELSLRFERVTLPDGQDQPIAAALTALEAPAPPRVRLDSEGHLRGTRPISWKGIVGGLVGLGGFAATQSYFAGAAVGATLPIGGGVLLGCALLLPRGSDVHLPPDTRIRLRLYHPLTVQVAW